MVSACQRDDCAANADIFAGGVGGAASCNCRSSEDRAGAVQTVILAFVMAATN